MKHVYLDDSYIKEVESKVEDVKHEGDNLCVCFDQNLYHAEGGGQPDDYGEVTFGSTTASFRQLIKQQGKTYSVFSSTEMLANVTKDDIACCTIDWERRHKIMRLHTLTHLVNAALARLYPDHSPQGVVISNCTSFCTVEADNISIENPDLHNKLLSLITDAIDSNLPITTQRYKTMELARQDHSLIFRSTYEFKGKVRMVIIDSLDANPCGGTHVKETGEIGEISHFEITTNQSQQGVKITIELN